MSLVANPFLSDRSLKIRAKAIPWDVSPRSPSSSPSAASTRSDSHRPAPADAGTLSSNRATSAQGCSVRTTSTSFSVSHRAATRQNPSSTPYVGPPSLGWGNLLGLTPSTPAQEGETYAALYIRLLNKLSRNDTLQFILVLLADFIAGPSPPLPPLPSFSNSICPCLADREERITLLINQPDSPYPPLLKCAAPEHPAPSPS